MTADRELPVNTISLNVPNWPLLSGQIMTLRLARHTKEEMTHSDPFSALFLPLG